MPDNILREMFFRILELSRMQWGMEIASELDFFTTKIVKKYMDYFAI